MKKILFLAHLVALACARAFRPEAWNDLANAKSHSPHGEGNKTFVAEASFLNKRHYIAVRGTDPVTQILVATSVDDVPLGPCTDEPAVGEYGNVALLGNAQGTMKVVAGGTVTAGEIAILGADGRVNTSTGAAADTYWSIGRFLTSGTVGQLVEITHHTPISITVV